MYVGLRPGRILRARSIGGGFFGGGFWMMFAEVGGVSGNCAEGTTATMTVQVSLLTWKLSAG